MKDVNGTTTVGGLPMREELINKRREANLSQTDVAKAVSISKAMYCRIEKFWSNTSHYT